MTASKFTLMIFTTFLIFSFFQNTSAQARQIKLSTPVLVTSCGQSPGSLKTEIFLNREKIVSEFDMLADVNKLKGNKYKTLFVISGVSREAMKAAGVNLDDEIKRIDELLKEAKKQGIKIIAAHVEGKGKRALPGNAESEENELLISLIFPKSEVMIVRNDGNEDSRFTVISQQNKNSLKLFKNNQEFQKILKDLFE